MNIKIQSLFMDNRAVIVGLVLIQKSLLFSKINLAFQVDTVPCRDKWEFL